MPVASDAIAALWCYIDGHRPRVNTGTVFLSARGLSLKRIYHISHKALDGARVRLGQPKRGFHLYRFIFVARMMENNIPIDTVSDLLGHSSRLSTVPVPYVQRSTDEALLPGEVLLYITPPADAAVLDEYFALGTSRVVCSLELWDEARRGGDAGQNGLHRPRAPPRGL
jgi:hypothetical protein